MSQLPVEPAPPALTVLYDGACPLCRREVGMYRDLVSLEPVRWLDISDGTTTCASPDERARFLARFHVRRADGQLLSGAAAFVALWLTLPGWRWLGRLGSLPGATAILDVCYRGFLRIRPQMQRLVQASDVAHLPADLVGDLRSDHAGETGAVWIYRGILLVSRDSAIRSFAERHLETERRHLDIMSTLLPPLRRSWMLPPWRLAGLVTGAVPALFGARAVYPTIDAVETFVDRHYAEQIDKLEGRRDVESLREALVSCRQDELAHRDEARLATPGPPNRWVAAWCAAVGRGSAIAVAIARRL